MCAGCKNLVFVKNLLSELGANVTLPMDTYTDNDAARLSTINPGTTARTKHYEIWMRARIVSVCGAVVRTGFLGHENCKISPLAR